ncbi:nitrate transporter [Chlorella sorokiniana]|jgi:NNP family nitrate/nitrite transporter-like MFS transporter|uniref:Nitrate transporter n=1 Tax=Chlorella sorokiniana TaxID=3076 RepID=A0A2P6TEB1_CHLSO|nr:nitrate transporter [Chlorella sorokiniana]|eukprot:PRW20984.1 nitrate transporter [Chlorella sorokiniana]
MVDDSAHGTKAVAKGSPTFTDGGAYSMAAAAAPRFTVPVDSENKSKVLKVWSFSRPHHLSFHLSWMSFMIAFFATFAAPPMLPVIRDNLDLTKPDIGGASIAAVTGAVFSRILLGAVCDSYGPRYGHGVLQLLCSAATFAMASITNAAGFIICRMVIGFSLATFVPCQFWCSVMFNAKIVGTANAVAAGWGNMGAGLTHLIMPYIYSGMASHQPDFIAWRCAYFVPGFAQIIIGLMVLLFGQDLPDGNYGALRKAGKKDKAKTHMELLAAVKNYRTWLLVLNYGYSFGVELTVDNNISPYLYDQFGIDLHTAGVLGAVFGLSNLFARALGGLLSDHAARRFGMRGRLWALWTVQSLGGVCSILMFYTSHSLGATMAVVAFWSIFIPMACGSTYGIAPFITRRGLGVATGLIGAGGNTGSAITQALFFTGTSMTTVEGFKWMGVMMLAVTATLVLMHFPMWGGMLTRGNPNITEEEYYSRDYTVAEKEQGLHRAILNWANESRSNRGFKEQLAKLSADLTAAAPTTAAAV